MSQIENEMWNNVLAIVVSANAPPTRTAGAKPGTKLAALVAV